MFFIAHIDGPAAGEVLLLLNMLARKQKGVRTFCNETHSCLLKG